MRRVYFTPIFALAISLSAAAVAKDDDKARTFLKSAMQGDNSEVMLGKLASEKASGAAAKHYAQMLVDDHSMHLQKVEKVAGGLNVPAEHQAAPEAEKERDKLSKLQGAKFDHEFAEYMVKDHRKDIAEYEKAARMTGDVGQLARDTLPTLHKHLSEAEKLGG